MTKKELEQKLNEAKREIIQLRIRISDLEEKLRSKQRPNPDMEHGPSKAYIKEYDPDDPFPIVHFFDGCMEKI